MGSAWCCSRVDLNGLCPPLTLLVFSLPVAESIKSSSLTLDRLFFPQIRKATTANPPSKIAPPTPPTTPPMIFFEESDRPELDPPELLPLRPGALEELAEADAASTT